MTFPTTLPFVYFGNSVAGINIIDILCMSNDGQSDGSCSVFQVISILVFQNIAILFRFLFYVLDAATSII